MKIAIFSDYDIAGNLTMLNRLINEHTPHTSRCIIVMGDYLNYDSDIVLIKDPTTKYADPKAIHEAENVLTDADFYHIGRSPINFGSIKFENLINKNNCVIQYFGSVLRNNKAKLRQFHESTGIHGITWVDATMMEGAGPMFYHFPDMFDISKVQPWWRQVPAEPIRIVHSPTNRGFKKTDFFLSIMENIQQRFKNVELVLLEGLSNTECLAKKQQAHILFDQVSVGRFALSAVESMAMGHAVLCSVSNLVMSRYPDSPVIPVTEESLQAEIDGLLTNPDRIHKLGMAGIEWVKANCDPIKAVRQYAYLYDYIKNGNRLITSDEKLGRKSYE